MGMPINILFTNNTLIINDAYGTNFYKSLNLETNKVTEFLKKGRGPNEVTSTQPFIDNESHFFITYCNETKELQYFDINELSKDEIKPSLIRRLKNTDLPILANINKLNNKNQIARYIDFSSSTPYCCLNDSFRIIKTGGTYPANPKIDNLSSLTKALIFQGFLVYNKQLNKGLTFFSKCKGFELIEEQRSQIATIKQSIESFPQFKIEDNEGNVAYTKDNAFGYLYASQTPNYAYALYSGKSYNATKGNLMECMHGNEIHVFNWNGELKSIIQLDTAINIFTCVNDSVFYGISCLDEPRIIKFTSIKDEK